MSCISEIMFSILHFAIRCSLADNISNSEVIYFPNKTLAVSLVFVGVSESAKT